MHLQPIKLVGLVVFATLIGHELSPGHALNACPRDGHNKQEHVDSPVVGFSQGSGYSVEATSPRNSPEAEQYLIRVLGNRSEPVPDSIDWRQVPGRVARVKNQQLCGCSWAFGATGVLEGQQLNVTKGKDLIELSEQSLLDCAPTLGGCNGSGWTFDALQWVATKLGGINDAKSYPYVAKGGQECKFQKDKTVMSCKGPVLLPEGDEQTLKEVVAKYGPVGIRIEATQKGLFSYLGGVLKDDTCRNSVAHLQHSMLIVGYGVDKKQGDYWLVKNQWGKNWGESGYLKMARNYNNMCGLATRAVIAAF